MSNRRVLDLVVKMIKERTSAVQSEQQKEVFIDSPEEDDEDTDGELEFRFQERRLPKRNGSRPQYRIKIS